MNAIDNALREAVTQIYPEISKLELEDYKVRILSGKTGTSATTRVLVTTTDGSHHWTTVGVHPNVLAASWMALSDAIAYGLLKTEKA